MKYDEALRAWGAKHFVHMLHDGEEVDVGTVTVSMSATSGWGCSCSSDPSIEITITAHTKEGRYMYYDLDGGWWSFEDFLKDVVEAANGAVTLE